MLDVDYTSALLIFTGYILHFVVSWWERWEKSNRIGVVDFWKSEMPKWIGGFIATFICYLTLPQLGPYVGIEPPLGAAAAGYAASSLMGKVTSKVTNV